MSMSTIITETRPTVSGWPIPEERRTVSVLFADIVGSTALVDRLDPEDVRSLQRAYFDAVARVLHRYHGVVEKYVGDAVMALFGARRSDGFDAYRAVRAGLEIQRTVDGQSLGVGTPVRLRVGVATGEVMVDVPGSRDGRHGTASGAVITTAARLQAYAAPGAVVLCAATHRATEGLLGQVALPAVTVAGRATPLEIWRAEDTVTVAPAAHPGPLVGRRREVATATDRIRRALRDRAPRWLSLVGSSGSGRSRLLHELVAALPTVGAAPVTWCVAHCPPHTGAALGPVADLVRRFAGLVGTESPAQVRQRLTAVLTGLVPARRLPSAVRASANLLAAPDTSAEAADGVAAWQQALLGLAARQPVVVAVDDVDRADPRVLAFLRQLVTTATARGLALAVVVTHQPTRDDLRPGTPGRAEQIGLAALGTVDTGRLLRRLLVRAGRPDQPVDRLLPLVAGNPGYATAYVRLAVERGAGDPAELPVPDEVRRTLTARIDVLDGVHRGVLMAGATLGVRFTASAVDRVLAWPAGHSGPVLAALADRGLLGRLTQGGYAFVEPVLRRVALDRLPRAVRAEFAGRAAAGEATPGCDEAVPSATWSTPLGVPAGVPTVPRRPVAPAAAAAAVGAPAGGGVLRRFPPTPSSSASRSAATPPRAA